MVPFSHREPAFEQSSSVWQSSLPSQAVLLHETSPALAIDTQHISPLPQSSGPSQTVRMPCEHVVPAVQLKVMSGYTPVPQQDFEVRLQSAMLAPHCTDVALSLPGVAGSSPPPPPPVVDDPGSTPPSSPPVAAPVVPLLLPVLEPVVLPLPVVAPLPPVELPVLEPPLVAPVVAVPVVAVPVLPVLEPALVPPPVLLPSSSPSPSPPQATNKKHAAIRFAVFEAFLITSTSELKQAHD
jgi:hypothetical protein